MQGERVPVIHTVGFFAEEQRGGPGERFLRQLSALTGGTFQVELCSQSCAVPCFADMPCVPLCWAMPCCACCAVLLCALYNDTTCCLWPALQPLKPPPSACLSPTFWCCVFYGMYVLRLVDSSLEPSCVVISTQCDPALRRCGS